MNSITIENVDFIYKDVQAKGITMDVLLDEMVDHICCSIEAEINSGITFETAYNKLMATIDSSTFINIQHQTLLSTNLKFQNMKKSMVVLGSFGALFLWTGSILKMFHLPLAGVILLLGTAITIMGFFPLFFYTSYKEQGEKKNILLSLTGYLTLSFLMIGVLFKVQHWPGAAIALLIGQFLLVLLFLPLYLVNAYKKASETKAKFGYVLLIVLIGFGVIFMVSATRVSKETIDNYETINNEAIYVTKKFAQKNDSLTMVLKMKESWSEVQPEINKLQELAFSLDKHIETIKTDLENYGNVDENGAIRFKDNANAFRKSMLKDDNAVKLEEKFAKYNDIVLEMANNEYQKETLRTLLNFDLLTGLTYEQGFKHTPLIVGMAMLSEIQKNIQISEYQLLSSLE